MIISESHIGETARNHHHLSAVFLFAPVFHVKAAGGAIVFAGKAWCWRADVAPVGKASGWTLTLQPIVTSRRTSSTFLAFRRRWRLCSPSPASGGATCGRRYLAGRSTKSGHSHRPRQIFTSKPACCRGAPFISAGKKARHQRFVRPKCSPAAPVVFFFLGNCATCHAFRRWRRSGRRLNFRRDIAQARTNAQMGRPGPNT